MGEIEMDSRYIVLFDPICGSSRGHNYPTLLKYAAWLQAKGAERVSIWIPASDCKPTESFELQKVIPWVYEYFLPTGRWWGFAQRFIRKAYTKLRPLPFGRLLISPAFVLMHCVSLVAVRRSLLRAFKSGADTIFMPGGDYYSIMALCALAQSGRIPKSQKIVLRLMGVMESAGYIPGAQQSYMHALRLLLATGANVVITAETEKLASLLSRKLNIEVPVTYIPLGEVGGEVQRSASSNKPPAAPGTAPPFVLACLGGARADKGYFSLAQSAREIRRAFGEDISFRVQTMSEKNDDYNPQYELELAGLANVELLPSFLTDEQLFKEIGQADAILLPYSQGTYELRGSAILFDSLPFGKPLIGRRGTAFGDTIDSYGLGFTFDSDEDLQAAIRSCRHMTTAARQKLAERQSAYMGVMDKNLHELFNAKEVLRLY